jgi:hypothetical protein
LKYLSEVIKQATAVLLSLLIGLAPLESHAQAFRLIFETDVKDRDTTRLTIDFGQMSYDELGRLPEILNEHADVLPSAQQQVIVQAFVPKELDQAAKDEFAASLQEHLSRVHRKLTIKVVTVDIDTEHVDPAREVAHEMSVMEHAASTLPDEEVQELKSWRQGFKKSMARYKDWLKSGHTKHKDETVGGMIGYGRAALSACVWFGTNRLSFPAVMQVSASMFLDWFFSKHEMDVDIFKATHRLPGEETPYLGWLIRKYNDSPKFKSFVVGNAIGFVAANYFRFWSWIQNPERTSPPWSPDAFGTYGATWAIGSAAGAFGAQAPRMLRKKGYISSRTQYYIYSSYGFVFQMGGFLYGLGFNWPAIILTATESLTKTAMYGVAHYLPNKDPRAIVIHSGIGEKDTQEILYRVGLDERELKKFTDANFSKFMTRLKGGSCEDDVISTAAK